MNFSAFLVGMVGPLAARWLASMGLSLVVMTGAAASIATLRDTFVQNMSAAPVQFLQLAGLFGIWECVGLWLGGVTFALTWATTRGFWTLAKT